MSAHHLDHALEQQAPQRRSRRANANKVLPDASAVDARFAIQQSSPFQRTLELCRLYAPIRRPIVFVGPIGVGKSTLARLVHELSGRAGRFVTCSAGEIHDSLAQSILFGHVRGAFTGAIGRRTGIFESAASGTLLLDDIANLSTHVQSNMLRVLEDRVFTPLGATRDIAVSCRELYATTQSLETLEEEGSLVPDFLSRMGEMVVEVPPLKERPNDILPLAEYYLGRVVEDFESTPVSLSADVRQLFERYPWPHNVRELKSVIERAVVHAHHQGSGEITPDHLPVRLLLEAPRKRPSRRLTGEIVMKTYLETGGNVSETARLHGVHRNTIYAYLPASVRRRTLSIDDPRR